MNAVALCGSLRAASMNRALLEAIFSASPRSVHADAALRVRSS
jgi:NAD(P)H-dependent FMN reductase